MKTPKYFKTLTALLLIVILLLLPGCWDRQELNKWAIVAGIGFDFDPATGLTTMTYQSIVPSQVKNTSGVSGGEGPKGGGATPAVQIDHGTGINPHEAVSRCTQHASRLLFYPQAEIYIFGMDLARHGVNPSIDTIARIVDSRPDVPVAIADIKASDILTVRDGMENIQASGVANSIKLSATVFSKYPMITFLEFCNRFMSKTTAPIAPILGIYEETGQDGEIIKKVIITGTAVFKGERMIGKLNEQESRGLLWVINKVKKGYVIIPETNTSLQIAQAKSKIIPELRNGKIKIRIEVEEHASLALYTEYQDLSPSIFKELERRQAEQIKKEIMAAVNKSFALRADVFGFGEAVHRRYKKEWKSLQPNWDDIYPNIEVEVKVKTHLHEAGDINKAVIKH